MNKKDILKDLAEIIRKCTLGDVYFKLDKLWEKIRNSDVNKFNILHDLQKIMIYCDIDTEIHFLLDKLWTRIFLYYKKALKNKYVGGFAIIKDKKTKPSITKVKSVYIKKGTFTKEQISELNKQLNRFTYYQNKTINTYIKLKKSLNLLNLGIVLNDISIKFKSRTELRNTLITYLYNNSNTVNNVTDAYLKNYDYKEIIKCIKQILKTPRVSLRDLIIKSRLSDSYKQMFIDQLNSLSDDVLNKVLNKKRILNNE